MTIKQQSCHLILQKFFFVSCRYIHRVGFAVSHTLEQVGMLSMKKKIYFLGIFLVYKSIQNIGYSQTKYRFNLKIQVFWSTLPKTEASQLHILDFA